MRQWRWNWRWIWKGVDRGKLGVILFLVPVLEEFFEAGDGS